MNVSGFHRPFDAVRIAIRAGRKSRRQPTLLPQERHRQNQVFVITREDAHDDVCDGGRARRPRLRAGKRPGPF